MKKLLTILCLFFSSLTYASTFYINGITTSPYGAEAEKLGVQGTLNVPMMLLYNYTKSTSEDMKQVLLQKKFEKNFNTTAFLTAWNTFNWQLDNTAATAALSNQQKALAYASTGWEDSDYLKMLTSLKKYNSGPVYIIGYSQGSLYANKLVQSALAANGTFYRGAIAVNIASMTAGNIGSGQYMTNSKDLVAKTLDLGYPVLNSNISLPFHWNEKLGHDLLKVYLKDNGQKELRNRYNYITSIYK